MAQGIKGLNSSRVFSSSIGSGLGSVTGGGLSYLMYKMGW